MFKSMFRPLVKTNVFIKDYVVSFYMRDLEEFWVIRNICHSPYKYKRVMFFLYANQQFLRLKHWQRQLKMVWQYPLTGRERSCFQYETPNTYFGYR